MACHNNEPRVGGCYRMRLARHNAWTNHVVLILAVAGEWCIITDLQAHGQPNPAAGEKLCWTNRHVQLEPVPRSELPLVARRYHARCGEPTATRRFSLPVGQSVTARPAADVLVIVS